MVLVFAPLITVSQSAAYKESFKKDVSLFESAKTASDFIYAATCFEKLAITEKKEWLAFYYAGLCNALAAFNLAYMLANENAPWYGYLPAILNYWNGQYFMRQVVRDLAIVENRLLLDKN